MSKIDDKILVSEIEQRLGENKRMREEINKLMQQLEDVNEKLQEAERVKSHFISNVRNQIINPFASVLGLSKSILSLGNDNWEKVVRMTQLIYTEAFELDFQLKNIFTAAKIEAGDCQPEYMNVEIIQLINNVIESFNHKSNSRQIEIKLSNHLTPTENTEFYLVTDPLKIQVILINLISNAIEYSSMANTIEVKLWMEENNLCFSVKDHGIGINEIDQKLIFDRFKRLDTSINSINRGNGLGLSVVKSLVDSFNGHIEVQSKRNFGSVFICKIPSPEANMYSGNFIDEGNEILFDDEIEKF